MEAVKRTAFVLLGLGLAVMAGGIGWGALFVGVPYPDPTPAQRAEEAVHLQVMNTTTLTGLAALVGSIALILLWLLWKLVSRRPVKVGGADKHDLPRHPQD